MRLPAKLSFVFESEPYTVALPDLFMTPLNVFSDLPVS